jgi:hypothetical protein
LDIERVTRIFSARIREVVGIAGIVEQMCHKCATECKQETRDRRGSKDHLGPKVSTAAT